MGRLRIVLALLVVDWTIGTPGLGVDTRTGGPELLGWVYGIASLALIIALALTWLGKRYAGPLAMAVGVAAVVLAITDIFGLIDGAPTPAGMLVVDAAGIAIGVAVVWVATRAGRRMPVTA